ncbi:MAG TPA: MOSC domain-containing protein [Streptosporangiaceae bacterium]|nr:MOSC domain-containing protein [Streptosporangiaceae bacterium]
MASARIVSVNTGAVRDLVIGGKPDRSAIDKRPADGMVRVGRLGLAGDDHGDTENHGGLEQAVYAYASEDLDWWTEQLGRELPSGAFGENVTTAGIDVSTALIGETWRMGQVLAQVTSPRIPCETFRAWTGEDRWVRRFAAAGRPGAYLRVLTEGELGAADDIEVLARPEQHVTVAESMLAYYGDAALMRKLLTVPGRGAKWDAIAERVLGRMTA